ncbi:MAG TPA: class I SAM-dependent methyltransferase [Pyrinomonadaceae bacterium]
MSSYGHSFARVYNQNSVEFANRIAPRLLEYFDSHRVCGSNKTLLDVGCGTGQLARYFLDRGYKVLGLDNSPGMLHYARENISPFISNGQGEILQADASCFDLPQRFGMAVATRDTINHFRDLDALRGCLASISGALIDGGVFIFDLNTRLGISERWNSVLVSAMPETVLINRKTYPGGEHGYASVTGFIRLESGLYERFDENFRCTIFDVKVIKALLAEAGFGSVYFAEEQALSKEVSDPERLLHVIAVAEKCSAISGRN